MRIDKGTIASSPFVGIFACVTEKIALVPYSILPKEETKLKDVLGVEIVKCKIADSSLIGVMCTGIGDKFVVSELAMQKELNELREIGLKLLSLKGSTAIGNLLRVNDKGAIASKALTKKQVREIEEFLDIDVVQTTIANLDIVGSAVMACNAGFIAHPGITKEEFEILKNTFKTEGIATTLNYGDPFAGNNAIANSTGMVVGDRTTTHEMIKLSDIFV